MNTITDQQFLMPGTLSILVRKDNGPIEQIHNLDGFRICAETQDIHYAFFDGNSWVKDVLTGYKLQAMRANWGHKDHMDRSYCFSLFLEPTSKSFMIVGAELSMFFPDKEGTHYHIGNTSGKTKQTSYYSGEHPNLKRLVEICCMDIKSSGFSYDEDLVENLQYLSDFLNR